ncbi:membrane protein [Histophilus somni]|uniref:Acetyl-CoA carboxylase carboxyltransferase subunit alpha n=1 Tax=Histophilus somni (strain 129Pt) TaxID=205914 RepID=Q0I5J9_HISS1|nr:membrane protein [Histophilus somni]QQF65496.1 hypothetical protein JFL60_08420 [Histophilus somni]QQF70232.1 hypothetical protein JFL59_08455 [Histophilus somni]QQF78542.1 hypothetical protein JFL53_08540 [Histophilus somni]QQF83980.1 hypothetical protein JFL54_08455 [Histophilus somni]
MALQPCPECRRKISECAISCPHCGFSLQEENWVLYREKLKKHCQYNQEINRTSVRIHLFWLVVFSIVIGIAGWLSN